MNSLFNKRQIELQSQGKKPLLCLCVNEEICHHTEFTPSGDREFPELEECEKCGRLIPFCYMGDGDSLCNYCWATNNWQSRSVAQVVLKGKRRPSFFKGGSHERTF